jgi:KaiC/GvpD/RAD55 family RecA-like ATPase
MHTKGPWTRSGNIIITREGEQIALIKKASSPSEVKQQASVRSLITAAPELLEALERLIYTLNNLSEWEDHTEEARAIVHKAKGANDESHNQRAN